MAGLCLHVDGDEYKCMAGNKMETTTCNVRIAVQVGLKERGSYEPNEPSLVTGLCSVRSL